MTPDEIKRGIERALAKADAEVDNSALGKFGRFVEKALPVAGAIAGNMILPGIGAVIGGTAGGALSGYTHGKNPLKSGLRGAGIGAITSFGAPIVGNVFGATGKWAHALGMGGPTDVLGRLGGAAGIAKGAGLTSSTHLPLSGMSSGIGGMLGGVGGGLDKLLMGTALVGGMLGREKTPREPNIHELMQQAGGAHYHEPKSLRAKNYKRKFNPRPVAFDPNDPNTWTPHQYFDNPNMEFEQYAHGGWTGESGGAEDNINTRVRPGTYFLNATDISLLGDGNTKAGMKKAREFIAQNEHGIYNFGRSSRKIKSRRSSMPVKVSDGEIPIPPEVVSRLGKGDNNKGAKRLDRMRHNLRKEKGVRDILPPKSKSIQHYLGM